MNKVLEGIETLTFIATNQGINHLATISHDNKYVIGKKIKTHLF
jgi:cell division GTPase FtsZ